MRRACPPECSRGLLAKVGPGAVGTARSGGGAAGAARGDEGEEAVAEEEEEEAGFVAAHHDPRHAPPRDHRDRLSGRGSSHPARRAPGGSGGSAARAARAGVHTWEALLLGGGAGDAAMPVPETWQPRSAESKSLVEMTRAAVGARPPARTPTSPARRPAPNSRRDAGAPGHNTALAGVGRWAASAAHYGQGRGGWLSRARGDGPGKFDGACSISIYIYIYIYI